MKSSLSHREIGALDWFCLRAISFYQRQISPRKGYRCAHARLHGGAGCSGFAREAIAQSGLRAATPQIRARFRDCKLAAQTLKAQNAPNSDEAARPKRRWHDNFSDACCVDYPWVCCADSLFDGAACEAASCADASCADAACGCHSCW